MKKQSKKFMLAGVLLLAIAGLLALTSCKNDSVPEPPSEETWLQKLEQELEGKTEGTITAPSYLTKGGLVDIAKLLHGLPSGVKVDLDLSQATGLTYIAAGTFIGCSTLQSVELPSSVTEIGSYAFSNCKKLTKVTIPEGVTTIGAYAFQDCTGLTEVAIPKGVTLIGSGAFYSCTDLREVTILEGVTTIGSGAFNSCKKLTKVTIPKGVTTIEGKAFAYTGLTKVDIPDGVTTIGSGAFMNCDDLNQVTFENKDGWCTKTDLYDEAESPDPINVGTPSTNATKLKDDAGQWSNKYLIRK